MKVYLEVYCEQRAKLIIEVPDGTTLSNKNPELHEAAMMALDDSGGAEWDTEAGWIEAIREVEDGEVL